MKVQLAKPHTHAGVKHPENTVLDVNEADEKWLRENDVLVKSNKQTRWLKPVPNEETDQ